MLRATLKDLWARKIRLVTTSIAVLLGVAFMSGTLVLTDTLGRTFDDLFDDVWAGTDAVVRAEATVDSGPGAGGEHPRVDASLLATVAAVDGVAVARGTVQGYAQVVGKDGKAIGNPNFGPPTFGGEWADDALNPYVLRQGRAPVADDEAVLDRAVADDAGVSVGDRVTIITPEPLEVTVVGIATFGSVDSALGATFVGMNLAAAQRHFAEPGKFDSVGVLADDGVSRDELKRRIAAVLPAGHEVVTGAELTAESQDESAQAIGFFERILLVFGAVALFVGSFIIYNTFGIIVAQRTRELALLRALGASRRQVLRSVLVEAAIIGLVASVLGLLAGVGLASLLRGLLRSSLQTPAGSLVVSPTTIVVAVVTGVVVSVVSAVLPARRASRVPPLAAMRDVAIDRSGTSTRRAVIGAGIVAVGVATLLSGLAGGDNALQKVGFGVFAVFIGVSVLGPVLTPPIAKALGAPLPRLKGMPGVLARENALRSPKRTASTAAALMIGVALVGFITVFASSASASIKHIVDERFGADLIVDSGSFGGMGGLPASVTEQLRALPEVAVASPVRAAPAKVEGESTFVIGFDPGSISAVYDLGPTAGSFADLDDQSAALQEDWAADHDKAVGDTIEVQLVEGPPQALTVRMLYDDNVFASGYFLPLSVFARGVPDQADLQIFVKIADGTTPDAARAAVQKATEHLPTAKVQDLTDFQESQTSQLTILLALVYVLLMLAIVIALIGIANTLALSMFERTREIGLLRAIGMTRRQLRSAVRWESILIALVGTTLGLALGVFFGRVLSLALRDEGFEIFSLPIVQLIVITVLAGIAGVIAAIWPARRAARLNVLAAISTE